MALTPVPVQGKQKSADLCNAFVAGAPKDVEGQVFFGVDESNLRMFNYARQKALKGDWWYIDNSYFDKVRGQQFRITKNRLQVDPKGKVSDGKRFAALGIEINPWQKSRSKRMVVCEQSASFMRDLSGDPDWLVRVAGKLGVSYKVEYRNWLRDKGAQQSTLPQALRDAALLVTYSSAAAITALLEGVNVEVSPASAAFDNRGGRLHLMQVLADSQFNILEMKDGTAWRMLNP